MKVVIEKSEPAKGIKEIALLDLVGQDLSGWHIARVFVLFRVDVERRHRICTIGYFGERVYADLYLQTLPDKPWLKVQEGTMLTDGINGIVISECEAVYVDQHAEKLFRQAVLSSIEPAIAKILQL